LAIREYCRIQTFPDEWQLSGSLSSQYKQIGNAVPVNLACAVGRSLISLLNSIDAKGDLNVYFSVSEELLLPKQLTLLNI